MSRWGIVKDRRLIGFFKAFGRMKSKKPVFHVLAEQRSTGSELSPLTMDNRLKIPGSISCTLLLLPAKVINHDRAHLDPTFSLKRSFKSLESP